MGTYDGRCQERLKSISLLCHLDKNRATSIQSLIQKLNRKWARAHGTMWSQCFKMEWKSYPTRSTITSGPQPTLEWLRGPVPAGSEQDHLLKRLLFPAALPHVPISPPSATKPALGELDGGSNQSDSPELSLLISQVLMKSTLSTLSL